MADKTDPRLIAKALRFLATGFEMAGESGVSARLERVDDGTGSSPYAAGLPKDSRATVTSNYLRIELFSARLPVDFLVQSIGRGVSELTLFERAGSVQACGGLAEFDGAERYALSSVHLSFSDLPEGFGMEVTMRLGEPAKETFVYAAPVDRSNETYRVRFQVRFDELFNFLFPATKAESEALIEACAERRGVEIQKPAFYVSDPAR